MNAVKPRTFWLVSVTVVTLFVMLFGIWTYTMVKSFRDVTSTSDTAPSPAFEKLNIEAYKRLFPEDK